MSSSLPDLRVTCLLCNGTGTIPTRTERAYARTLEVANLNHIRCMTLLGVLKAIRRVKSLDDAQDLCVDTEKLVWRVKG